jgi:large subunit ribosomal protein L15
VIKISEIRLPAGSKKKKKRVGRGNASGWGGTAGRGHKGQKSRSGGVKRPGFEGGQTPLYRRLPKLDRFKHIPFKKIYSILNVEDLNVYPEGAEIKPENLSKDGLLDRGKPLKILGEGKLDKKLNVYAQAFSGSAKSKIEAAGGQALVVK